MINTTSGRRLLILLTAVAAAGVIALLALAAAPTTPFTDRSDSVALPPSNNGFDYQIGGDYTVPSGAGSVSRDWYVGAPEPDHYNVCYINAFQTQDNDSEVDRPDEQGNWPADLVLTGVDQDPNWGGEYLIDISTTQHRSRAADHLGPMVETCADKGFDAVEYDNLDSWTRFEDYPTLQALVPFGRAEAIAFATLITQQAHDHGLAVAQKNTSDLIGDRSHAEIGFDFAVAEECGRYDECDIYISAYGDKVFVIEYNDSADGRTGFSRACEDYEDQLSIVIRDRDVLTPTDGDYFRDAC